MVYSRMIGICQTATPMTKLRGIGDDPLPLSDGASMILHKSGVTSVKGAKVDQHASFPKGLQRAFRLTNEYIRD